MNLAVIGCGNMASAIIGGGLKTNFLSNDTINVYDINSEKLNIFSNQYQLTTHNSPNDAVKNSDSVLISVKPQDLKSVLLEIADSCKGKLVISICAGKTISTIEENLLTGVAIARVNPNTPALVGEGATGIAFNDYTSQEQKDFVLNLFSSLGIVQEFPEKLMNAVTGLAGSGPAFIFMIVEAMADGGVLAGLPRADAIKFAAQTVLGAAKMVLSTKEHPGILKDKVASPGGTTIEGISVLEKSRLRSALIEAVHSAVLKADKLN